MQMCSLLWNAAAMEMKKFLGISSGMGRKEEIREEVGAFKFFMGCRAED
jgi:hypothetical protein